MTEILMEDSFGDKTQGETVTCLRFPLIEVWDVFGNGSLEILPHFHAVCWHLIDTALTLPIATTNAITTSHSLVKVAVVVVVLE